MNYCVLFSHFKNVRQSMIRLLCTLTLEKNNLSRLEIKVLHILAKESCEKEHDVRTRKCALKADVISS